MSNKHLIKASKEGNIQYIKNNIKNSNNYSKEYCLLEAAKYNHFKIVDYILKFKLKLSEKILKQLVFYACHFNHLYIVEKYCAYLSFSAIRESAVKGHLKIINYILSIKLYESLYRAIIERIITQKGHINIIRNLNVQTNWINEALESQNLEVVKYYIKDKNYDRFLVIHAIEQSTLEILIVLLDRIKIHTINNTEFMYHKSILYYAVINKKMDMIEYLVTNYDLELNFYNYDFEIYYYDFLNKKDIVKYLIQEQYNILQYYDKIDDIKYDKLAYHKLSYHKNLKQIMFYQEYEYNRDSEFNNNFTRSEYCEIYLIDIIFSFLRRKN